MPQSHDLPTLAVGTRVRIAPDALAAQQARLDAVFGTDALRLDPSAVYTVVDDWRRGYYDRGRVAVQVPGRGLAFGVAVADCTPEPVRLGHCSPVWGGHSPACIRDGSYCSLASSHAGPCQPHGSPACWSCGQPAAIGAGAAVAGLCRHCAAIDADEVPDVHDPAWIGNTKPLEAIFEAPPGTRRLPCES
jgi:hypothetical protein